MGSVPDDPPATGEDVAGTLPVNAARALTSRAAREIGAAARTLASPELQRAEAMMPEVVRALQAAEAAIVTRPRPTASGPLGSDGREVEALGTAGEAEAPAHTPTRGHGPTLTPMVPDFPTAYPAAYRQVFKSHGRRPRRDEVAQELGISLSTFKRYRDAPPGVPWPPI
jgi:hypothetical protein